MPNGLVTVEKSVIYEAREPVAGSGLNRGVAKGGERAKGVERGGLAAKRV